MGHQWTNAIPSRVLNSGVSQAEIDEWRAMREKSAGYVVTVDVSDNACCEGVALERGSWPIK